MDHDGIIPTVDWDYSGDPFMHTTMQRYGRGVATWVDQVYDAEGEFCVYFGAGSDYVFVCGGDTEYWRCNDDSGSYH